MLKDKKKLLCLGLAVVIAVSCVAGFIIKNNRAEAADESVELPADDAGEEYGDQALPSMDEKPGFREADPQATYHDRLSDASDQAMAASSGNNKSDKKRDTQERTGGAAREHTIKRPVGDTGSNTSNNATAASQSGGAGGKNTAETSQGGKNTTGTSQGGKNTAGTSQGGKNTAGTSQGGSTGGKNPSSSSKDDPKEKKKTSKTVDKSGEKAKIKNMVKTILDEYIRDNKTNNMAEIATAEDRLYHRLTSEIKSYVRVLLMDRDDLSEDEVERISKDAADAAAAGLGKTIGDISARLAVVESSSDADRGLDKAKEYALSLVNGLKESFEAKLAGEREESKKEIAATGAAAAIEPVSGEPESKLYPELKNEIDGLRTNIASGMESFSKQINKSVEDAIKGFNTTMEARLSSVENTIDDSIKSITDNQKLFMRQQTQKTDELEEKILELERQNIELTATINTMQAAMNDTINTTGQELQVAKPFAKDITPFEQLICWNDEDSRLHYGLNTDRVKGFRIYRGLKEDYSDLEDITAKAEKGLSEDGTYLTCHTFSFRDYDLSPDTTYYYWVTTVLDDNGDGVIDRENNYRGGSLILASATARVAVLQPSGVSMEQTPNGLVTGWDKPAYHKYVSGYDVYLTKGNYYGYDDAVMVGKKTDITGENTSFYGLDMDTDYYVVIRSVISDGYAVSGEIPDETTNYSAVHTYSGDVFLPKDAGAESVLNGYGISVSWTPSSYADYLDHYVVYYESEKVSGSVETKKDSVTIEGISPSTDYSISIGAVVKEGEFVSEELIAEKLCTVTTQTPVNRVKVVLDDSELQKENGSAKIWVTYKNVEGKTIKTTEPGEICVKSGTTIYYILRAINSDADKGLVALTEPDMKIHRDGEYSLFDDSVECNKDGTLTLKLTGGNHVVDEGSGEEYITYDGSVSF